jgi:hypothetical protein
MHGHKKEAQDIMARARAAIGQPKANLAPPTTENRTVVRARGITQPTKPPTTTVAEIAQTLIEQGETLSLGRLAGLIVTEAARTGRSITLQMNPKPERLLVDITLGQL